MAKYAAIDGEQIKAISDSAIDGAVPVPIELQSKTLSELIASSKVKDGQLVSKGNGGKRVAFVTNWKMRCGISTYNESRSFAARLSL